jgi:CRISPR-associated protein Csd1
MNFDRVKRDDYVKNTFSNNIEKLIYSVYDAKQIPEIFLYKSVQLASHYISIDQNKKDGKIFSKNQYFNAISTITLYINRKEEHMSNINAYTCGQIFAVYEKLQKDVTNSNNISNLFDMAKKHPSIILSRLATLSKHHLNSAKIKNSGISHYYAKMISELYAAIETIPNTLNIEEQAQFILGYYHQNNILYAKKEN